MITHADAINIQEFARESIGKVISDILNGVKPVTLDHPRLLAVMYGRFFGLEAFEAGIYGCVECPHYERSEVFDLVALLSRPGMFDSDQTRQLLHELYIELLHQSQDNAIDILCQNDGVALDAKLAAVNRHFGAFQAGYLASC